MRTLIRWVVMGLLQTLFRTSIWLYGGEGANLLLRVMPMQSIAPLLREFGATVGPRVRFHSPLIVHNAAIQGHLYHNLTVGSDCYLGRDLLLDLQDKIVIEDHVTVSLQVAIFTHTDTGDSLLAHTAVPTSQAPVCIGRGAYVGARATILQGVDIGPAAVVAAGAVVRQSVPAETLVAGVPARIARNL